MLCHLETQFCFVLFLVSDQKLQICHQKTPFFVNFDWKLQICLNDQICFYNFSIQIYENIHCCLGGKREFNEKPFVCVCVCVCVGVWGVCGRWGWVCVCVWGGCVCV